MKITALMMTAARAALGMKKKYGVNKLNDKIMSIPEMLENVLSMNSFAGIILHLNELFTSVHSTHRSSHATSVIHCTS